jgi:raffinose/stachyose/melibiose transport system substrate-binding protein
MKRRVAITGAALATAILPAATAYAAPHRSTASSAVTITIWNDTDGTPPAGISTSQYWVNRAISLFNETHPTIHVKVDPAPNAASAAFETELRTSEVAGNLPDVIQLYDGGQVLENAKYLLPLNRYISSSFKKSLNVGWQWVSSNYSNNGTIYGVPFGEGYWYVVFYNKKDFAKAGIKQLPSTWTEVMSDAHQLKKAGMLPFEVGEQQGYTGAWTEDAFISSLIGTKGVLEMYDGHTSLDSPAMIEAFNAWHQVEAQGLANSDALAITSNQAWAKFAAGTGAMLITGAGFNDGQFVSGLKGNLGLFPVPPLPGAKYPKVLSGGPNNEYSIAKNTKYPQQAMEFVKFMVSPKIQEMALAGGFGQLPNLTSYQLPKTLSDPVLAQVYKFIDVEHYGLAEAWDNVLPGSIDSYWYKTNTAVFGGSLTPGAAAQNMEQQMQQYLSTEKALG